MRGMLKAAKEEWENILLEMFKNAGNVTGRVLEIYKARGKHVENKQSKKTKTVFLVNFQSLAKLFGLELRKHQLSPSPPSAGV